jgi:hypothetical protein
MRPARRKVYLRDVDSVFLPESEVFNEFLHKSDVSNIDGFNDLSGSRGICSDSEQYFCYLSNRVRNVEEMRGGNNMAASTTARGFRAPDSSPVASIVTCVLRRRRISPEVGHALEILGHAIEYLTDEFVQAGGSFSARDGQVDAVQLLMAVNRQIYFSCPEVPSLGERWRSLLHVRTASAKSC